MKTFPTAKIRNVALVGHGGAGKTSLAEALLFNAGAIVRLGRVEDGSTVCDFDPEEQRRNISVSLALAPFELEDYKVNVLDAPGYADFVGDVAAAIQAADLALFVVSAVEGVEVQTEIAWKLAEQRGLPRAIFVNKLDRERASFSRTLDELKAKFGAGVAPLQLPIGEEAALAGVVDLLNDVAVNYVPTARRTVPKARCPTRWRPRSTRFTTRSWKASSSATTTSWSATSATRRSTSPSSRGALAAGVASGTVFPVLCGSATKLVGIDRLAKFLVEEAPAPALDGGEPGALVFKTIVDPYVGHVNLFKVLQGTVKHDDVLTNARSKADERMHQLFSMRGKEQDTVTEVAAGDIAAVAKLTHTATGDVLCAKGTSVDVEVLPAPEPLLAVAIHAKSKADEDKLANALHRLQEEDPVLRIERNAETHQTVLRGHGRDPPVDRAPRSWPASSASRSRPTTCMSRTARRSAARAEAEGKLKKQSGGHGQFAVACAARRAAGARRGQRVRRRDRRRCDPPQLHPRGREGRGRDRGARRRARLPGRRREGHLLRRQAPPRRQLRDGVQDRGRRWDSATRWPRPSPSCSSR